MALADLATPMAIRVAATLDLVEHAGRDGATAEELAARTATNLPALRCLLDHLAEVDVFDLDAASGRYRPTGLGNQLREDAPSWRLSSCSARSPPASPAYPRRYGRDFWADLDAEPRLRRSFDAQMSWRFQTQAAQIAQRFDWGRFPEILDVGGGDGKLLAESLRAHPNVRGRVLDLPPSAEAAAERFAAAGLADRSGTVPRSFFEPLPTGADAYLLSDIRHDWDDENARKILSGCAAAAAPNGTVIVTEPVRGQARAPRSTCSC